MAYLLKLKSGKWSAQIDRNGVRTSASFPTKAAAHAWATKAEADILARKRGQIVRKTFRQALERYSAEVSPTKKNALWEQTRIKFFCSDEFGLSFVDKQIEDISPDDFGQWRDRRLQGVLGSTINRDMNLISAVFSTCRNEWGWASHSPISKTRRPVDPKPRDRLISWREIRSVLRALDWHMTRPDTLQQQAGFAFLMSLHTGMRAGEVLRADYRKGVATLTDTKNGEARRVPLSSRAQRLVKLCPSFTITGASLDALFRKARERAGLDGFTFHDARATALTRMARRVDVLQLAKISGHKDISILSNTYYRETAESIGLRLR